MCAWILVVIMAARVVVLPFSIGKAQKPFTAVSYVAQILAGIPASIIAGRVLGWW